MQEKKGRGSIPVTDRILQGNRTIYINTDIDKFVNHSHNTAHKRIQHIAAANLSPQKG